LPRIFESDDRILIVLTTPSGWMCLHSLTRDA
jgi:hypothetical protein